MDRRTKGAGVRVIRPGTVALFRESARKCGLCGEKISAVEVHHVRGRCPQIDVRLNLLPLGLIFQCKCHYDGHYSGGRWFREACEEAVAVREECSADDLRAVVQLLWRAPFKTPEEANALWFENQAREWSE